MSFLKVLVPRVMLGVSIACCNVVAASSLDGQFNAQEMRELVAIFHKLCGVSSDSLPYRMDQLSLDEKILLYSWSLNEGQEQKSFLFEASDNQLAKVSDADAGNFKKSFEFSVQYKGDKRRRADGADYKLKYAGYVEALARRVLLKVREDINRNSFSEIFISGALRSVNWIALDESAQNKYAEEISVLMGISERKSVRRSLFECFYLIKNDQESRFNKYVDDADPHIALRAIKWMIEHGHKDLLPTYIRLTWSLYSNAAGKIDDQMLPPLVMSPEYCLLNIVPDSGKVFSLNSQLDWVANNIEKMNFLPDKEIYIVRKDLSRPTEGQYQ